MIAPRAYVKQGDVDASVQNEWTHGLTMDMTLLPFFIPLDLAKSILEAGKVQYFARRWGLNKHTHREVYLPGKEHKINGGRGMYTGHVL